MHRIRVSIVAGLAGIMVIMPVSATTAAAASAAPGQVITVSARTSTATTATVSAWRRDSTGTYVRVRGPLSGHVGADGVGKASESRARTPAGQWALTHSFGIKADPGTALPYFKADNKDWWDEDVHSSRYNTHQRCPPDTCPFNESRSEHLVDYPVAYQYAVIMDYNMHPVVRGAGSGFFLHVSNGKPTAGCVSVSRTDMVWLLRWLTPGQHPIVSIGVGSAAYAPVR